MPFIDRMQAIEALECVAVRVRWYETRGLAVPDVTMRTLRDLASELGVDPRSVENR